MSLKPVQVLHIITRLDPGGSAENTVLSAERVDSSRFESTVWTGPGLEGQGPPLHYAKRLGDSLHVLHHLVRPIQPTTDLFALADLIRGLRHFKPDIVHLHSAKAGVLGRLAVRLARCKAKVVYTPHGHVFSGYGGGGANALFTQIERFLAFSADAIVGLTADESREFLSHHAGKPEQFCVIPSGVDLTPFLEVNETRAVVRQELGISDDTLVVGFIGRFEEVKGPDIALQVMNKVLRQRKDAFFLFVGDGSMRDGLEKQVAELGLSDMVSITGWREDISRLLKAMDLFLLTSRNEGQGRVLVEAMATGLPIVATDTGGVSEVVVDGLSGILTALGDVESTASAVIELLGSGDRRTQLGVAGRNRAQKHFSVEEMIRRLELLYEGLLQGKEVSSIMD